MVSAWWLLVTFWIGGVLGLVLGALAATARHPADDTEERRETPPQRWGEERGSAPPQAGSHARGGTLPRG